MFVFQLDFAAERNKVALSNAEGYKKEIALLRDKLQKYTASVAKHEQTINSQRQVILQSYFCENGQTYI